MNSRTLITSNNPTPQQLLPLILLFLFVNLIPVSQLHVATVPKFTPLPRLDNCRLHAMPTPPLAAPIPPTGAGPSYVAIGTSLIRTSLTLDAHISLESLVPLPLAPHMKGKLEHVSDLRRSLLWLDTDRDHVPR